MSSNPLPATTNLNIEEHIALRRVPAVGLLTLVVALISNILIGTISYALFPISGAFIPLNLIPIAFWTLVGVLGAVLVFSILVRFATHPLATFSKITLIVLLLSLIPDLVLFYMSPFPATTPLAVIALMLMHVSTATLCLGFLTSLCTEPDVKTADNETYNDSAQPTNASDIINPLEPT
ncbi:DUF6069 family protein [Dictyobacter kobayashii]|uniref:Uncharacterized protein n=1 Tax=Dictyobacter kobayashii TaxID=2014872 RepID=A0A402AXI3_9CHLR|nr:DUF6069 family protein [Dictyobacter kobayashii]GCE23850.1 hypothetical protein KDK_76500 [Dictyobacter kobayashii]